MTKGWSPARIAWKWRYRQLRIIRRECAKAAIDMMLFGQGWIETGRDVPDLIRHIPIEEARA